jgi:hypothetical protein
MKLRSKVVLIASLIAIKVVISACETGSSSTSSGSSSSSSSSSSYTLKPKTHNSSYATSCHVQTATQYQAADIRYDQYAECMSLYNGDPSCEGYYTNYQSQVNLAEQTRASIGC